MNQFDDWGLLHRALEASRREVRAAQTAKADCLDSHPGIQLLRSVVTGGEMWRTSPINAETQTCLLKNAATRAQLNYSEENGLEVKQEV